MERYTKSGFDFETTNLTEGLFNSMGAALNRLAAYEDAEEQGLLVRLPCKRGDKVWRICGPKHRKFVAERTVLSVTMYEPGVFEIYTNCFDWLGKTVFLARQEAEKALGEANQNG